MKVQNFLHTIILSMIGIALAACGTTGEGRRTSESRYSSLETRRAILYTTATVAIERQLVTVEYANTQLARAKKQQDEMVSTLGSREIEIVLPQAATMPPTPTEGPTIAPIFGEPTLPPATQAAVAPQVTPFAPASPTSPPVIVTTQQETSVESTPLSLRDITMATAVDNNDCALNITNSFNTATEEIYIVARAINIQAGTVITSRWMRNELELTVFNFTPGFAIENACIWFFADQTDFDFTPGNYSVTLEVNGIQASQPTPFTIVNAG